MAVTAVKTTATTVTTRKAPPPCDPKPKGNGCACPPGSTQNNCNDGKGMVPVAPQPKTSFLSGNWWKWGLGLLGVGGLLWAVLGRKKGHKKQEVASCPPVRHDYKPVYSSYSSGYNDCDYYSNDYC